MVSGMRDIPIPKEKGQGGIERLEHIEDVLRQYRALAPHLRQEILLVTDNERYSHVIRRMLVYKGYDVETMDTVDKGIDYCIGHEPKVVIVDADMGNGGAVRFANLLQAHERHIPIIGLLSQDADSIPLFQVTVDKAFAPRDLVGALQKIWSPVEVS